MIETVAATSGSSTLYSPARILHRLRSRHGGTDDGGDRVERIEPRRHTQAVDDQRHDHELQGREHDGRSKIRAHVFERQAKPYSEERARRERSREDVHIGLRSAPVSASLQSPTPDRSRLIVPTD